MATKIYAFGLRELCNGSIDWDDNTGTDIYCALTTSAFTFNDDHDYFADVTNELSGTGYTAGGNAITTRTATHDTTNDRLELDGDNVTWTGINAGTAAVAVIYKDTGTDTTSPLIAYIDIADTATNGSDLTIQWDAEGIIQIASA